MKSQHLPKPMVDLGHNDAPNMNLRRHRLATHIAERLTALAWQLKTRGRFTDANHVLEVICKLLLNALFGWNLENLNIKHSNYPAADLGDLGHRIALQITNENKSHKITETVEKAIANKLGAHFDRLIIFFFLPKKPALPRKFTQPLGGPKVETWDLSQLLELMMDIDDLDCLASAAAVLDNEMGRIPPIDSELSVLRRRVKCLVSEAPNAFQGEGIIVATFADIRSGPANTVNRSGLSPFVNEGVSLTKDIEALFEETGRALLILGEAGSGKTVTLERLAKSLILKAELDAAQPIPVIFKLSSWSPGRLGFSEWLVNELTKNFHVDHATGHEWLRNKCLLLLLDGLDEVRKEAQSACVQSILDFIATIGCRGIAISCRNEHDELAQMLNLFTISVQPLTLPQINQYIDTLGPSLKGLKEAIAGDGALQKLLSAPFFLIAASRAFRDRPVDSVVESVSQMAGGSLRQHLLARFVEAQLRKHKERNSSTCARVLKFIVWIARQMAPNNLSVFLIEDLQPSWLSGTCAQAIYYIVSRALCAVLLWVGIFGVYISLNALKWSTIGWKGFLFGGLGAVAVSVLEGFAVLKPAHSHHGWLDPFSKRILLYSLIGLACGTLWAACLDGRSLQRIHTDFISVHLTGWSRFGLCVATGLLATLLTGPFILVFGLRAARQCTSKDISRIESISWSRKECSKGFENGGVSCAMLFAVGGIALGFEGPIMFQAIGWGPNSWIGLLAMIAIFSVVLGVIGFITGALIGGAVGYLLGGFSATIVDSKARLNQGIHLSVRNAFFASLCTVAAVELLSFVLRIQSEPRNLLFGISLATLCGLWFGGFDVIQHYTLRMILSCESPLPILPARFLEIAEDLAFLKKRGGSYEFFHPMLLEYFSKQFHPDKLDQCFSETLETNRLD